MLSSINRAKFRVKIKSLMDEARTIRKEEKRCKGPQMEPQRNSLYLHRVKDVRGEQRATFLAYAYSRGVAYSVLERTCNTPIDYKAVKRILKSLAEREEVHVQDLVDWVAGAPAKVAQAA
jgi:hypothetical protein